MMYDVSMNNEIPVEIKAGEYEVGTKKTPTGHVITKMLGWVAGEIISHDGIEWLYSYNGLCSLDYRKPNSNPAIFKTQEKAIEHVRKFKSNWKKFIRPYYHLTYKNRK